MGADLGTGTETAASIHLSSSRITEPQEFLIANELPGSELSHKFRYRGRIGVYILWLRMRVFLEIYPKFCAHATIVKIRPPIARTANGR